MFLSIHGTSEKPFMLKAVKGLRVNSLCILDSLVKIQLEAEF